MAPYLTPTSLTAEVYTPGYGNCSNGGLSSKFTSVTDTDDPTVPNAVQIERWHGYFRATPLDVGGRWAMMGGCFIFSSDSRWRERYPHPIPFHDRFEG